MTAVTVKREIADALKNKIVSTKEVGEIIAATGKSVSNAEAKPIGDLYQVITGPRPMVFLPGQDWPRFGKGAGEKLNAFFVKSKLPFGDGEEPIRARMEAALARIRMVPLDEKPNVSRLVSLYMPTPDGMLDGPSRTAYYDVAKEQFFLNVADPWRPNGVDVWYGPISIKGVEPLPEEPPAIAPETLDRASRAYTDLSTRALIDWASLPTSMPMGARTVEAEFMRERRPDGYAYSAVFQVGALAPGASPKDPNLLDDVFIKRSGPDGDRILGPIDMTEVDGGVKATTLAKLRAALDQYLARADQKWLPSPPVIAPGAQGTNVLVRREPGFDTYSYGAFLVGDANDPQSVVFARSGGLMGRTFWSEPVALDVPPTEPVVG